MFVLKCLLKFDRSRVLDLWIRLKFIVVSFCHRCISSDEIKGI
jgi:hypothetical protein